MAQHQKPHNIDELLAPPTVDGMLPDIPGGEPNLLPGALVRAPLRVEVPRWPRADPGPGRWQRLSLFWNGQLVDSKQWEAPIPDDELFIDVPVSFLREGRSSVSYNVRLYSDNVAESEALVVTIDWTAPLLGGGDGALSLPELGDETLNEAYLAAHDDTLQALLPEYDSPAIGDTLIYYWDSRPYEKAEAGRRSLVADDLGQPLAIEYSGDLIRARGDGLRYAYYEVQDRAGNLSRGAQPISVDVAVQPIPRELPGLEMPQGSGSAESMELELNNVSVSVELVIPSTASIEPGEPFEVHWGAPEASFSVVLSGVPNVRRYSVPIRNVVAMSGKTIVIYYVVKTPGGTLRSEERQVVVKPVPRERMSTLSLATHRSGEIFRLSDHLSDPPLILAAWMHIATDQRLNIMLSGVGPTGPVTKPVLRQHAVTTQEVRDGIGSNGDLVIPLATLQQLSRGQDFRIEAKVSFDQGETWPLTANFPMLSLTLQD